MQVTTLFSPGDACGKHIRSLMREAQERLDICVFTISDNDIADAIKNAFDRGINVRIVTDNDKLWDEGSDIKALYEHGIEVKIDQTDYHMHHKFMVVDGHTVLTGSYNWTRSAAQFNHENIISFTDRQVSQKFSAEFEKLWEECVGMEDN